MLVLFCVKLYDLDDNVCRQIHSLDSDVFVRADRRVRRFPNSDMGDL